MSSCVTPAAASSTTSATWLRATTRAVQLDSQQGMAQAGGGLGREVWWWHARALATRVFWSDLIQLCLRMMRTSQPGDGTDKLIRALLDARYERGRKLGQAAPAEAARSSASAARATQK